MASLIISNSFTTSEHPHRHHSLTLLVICSLLNHVNTLPTIEINDYERPKRYDG